MRALVFGVVAGLISSTAIAEKPQPLKIENDVPQLFVDDYLIESQANLKRTLHQPRKDNGGNVPVLAITDEHPGKNSSLQANGTIVFDPKLKKWVMIAIAHGSEYPVGDANRVRMYRFTSDDAMNWTRGDDGDAQHIKFEYTDATGKRKPSKTDLFSFHYDQSDSEWPYQGWLWFANKEEPQGVYFVRSRDGRQWERGRQIMQHLSRKIEQDGSMLQGPSDVTTFWPDPVTGRFLALIKFHGTKGASNGNYQRSRAYAFVDRLDEPFDMNRIERLALVPPAAQTNGDQPFDEYYATTAWRHGPLWLGGLKIWHRKDDYPHSAAGCAFMKMVVSHDGLNWQKIQFDNDAGVSEVWIPNGPEGGNVGKNDGGYISEFSQGPLRIGDELIFYYGSSSFGKNHPENIRMGGGGIFRARLRPDGFVSVDAGTLTTRPLGFEGSTLLINSVGPVTVEALKGEQSVAEASVTGDSLAHEINWEPKSLQELKGDGELRLRFTIGEGGKLYSFRIQ